MGIKQTFGKLGFEIRRNAPILWFVGGTACVAGTIITSVRAGSNISDILKDHRERKAVYEVEKEELYSEKGPLKDGSITEKEAKIAEAKSLMELYRPTVVKITKEMALPIAFGAGAVFCFGEAFHILNTRYVGAVAAYNGVKSAFDNYRQRVREEGGDELDRHYMFGTEKGDKVEDIRTKEDGTEEKKKVQQEKITHRMNDSIYARVFEPKNAANGTGSREWDSSRNYNLSFLTITQSNFNKKLQESAHGFVTINEVYQALGFDPVAEGMFVGWTRDGGDGYISFGLDNLDDPNVVKFLNHETNVVPLDFNVDGIIYDVAKRQEDEDARHGIFRLR